jgi:type II secretory pathway component PulM
MKDWFLRFTPREQIALLVMAAAIMVYTLVLLLFLPLGEARREMAARNAATAEALARVEGLASRIEALRDGAETQSRSEARNLTALVNASAERFGLRPTRLQPNGRGAVQVRFESAPLAPLLRWIHEVENERGLVVEELSLNQTQLAASVSVTARIAALP